ncbi:ribosome-associated translation inhibitor RaiA [Patescibacteria group bacterium]|nr:ribosome-associated translation inhibitor RaiA [Patescibacteria group bacterium]
MRLVEIKGTNIDISDYIEDYVENKLKAVAKLTEKFEPCDIRIDVGKTTKHQSKGRIFHAEFNLTIPGKMLRAEATGYDLYDAIDIAANELRRRVVDFRDKMIEADRVPTEMTIEEIEEMREEKGEY